MKLKIKSVDVFVFVQVLEPLVFEIYFAKHVNARHVSFISMKSMLLAKKDVESTNRTHSFLSTKIFGV
jgi:hypothetical protein